MPAKSTKCHTCPQMIRATSATGLCVSCYGRKLSGDYTATPQQQVQADRDKQRSVAETSMLRKKYDEALKTVERQERELRSLGAISDGIDTFKIEPRYGTGTSEATPVILASDWHSEEVVTLAQTSGLNEFNADICKARVTKFFQSSLRLIKLLNQDVTINTVVLALLGDFITGHLHEEAAETNALHPMHAIVNAQNLIASGFEFLLANTPYNFIVPCKVGNHSRTTKKVRFGTENGHSLEHLMYVGLANHFRLEPRMKFMINDGYHTYLDVYDTTIRFHHGHALSYSGGVGGIYIGVNKAIAQWSKARRATLDAFGHWHQLRDGGNFICNGSLVGYNAYALSGKFEFEQPKQALFLIDKTRGRTCSWPVLL